MREVILQKIQSLKEENHGFAKNFVKWQVLCINDTHISEIDFSTLSDEKLLFAYDQIILRVY